MIRIEAKHVKYFRFLNHEAIITNGILIIIPLNNQIANLQPAIISKTQDIKLGDQYFNPRLNNFGIADDENINYNAAILSGPCDRAFYKVLVLSEQISNTTLEDIVDGKIHNGDNVHIELYRRGLNSDGIDADLTGGVIIHSEDYYTPRLSDNRANILIAEKEKTWWDIMNEYDDTKTTRTFQMWLSDTYNVPTKKK